MLSVANVATPTGSWLLILENASTIIIRNMEKGQQRIVPFDTVLDEVVKLIGENNLDTYSPGEIGYL